MRISNSIEIAAPVEQVWDLTMDVESWPQHTPTITRIQRLDGGPLRVGAQARIKQPAQGERTWTVTSLVPRERFEWATSAMGVRMAGGHHLASTPGGTRNTLTVDIEGWLAPLVGLLIRGAIRKAIATENEGFRRAAEASRHQSLAAVG